MIEYKYFYFSDVFEYERGTRYKKEDHVPGEIAYISSSAKNNGLDAYISPPDNMVIYQNKLTMANSGSVGYCFYHKYEFVASDHVMVIWIKNYELNENIALFLKPIFEKIKYRYSFGREINKDRLINEVLYLPIDNKGNPNWSYMNSYIAELKNRIKFYDIPKSNTSKVDLNIDNWIEFNLKDIFEIGTGASISQANLIEGEIPRITATSVNNGIGLFTDFSDNANFRVFSNIISISFLGSYFYHPDTVSLDIKIHYIKPKSKELNIYTALFIISCLRHALPKPSYGYQINSTMLKAGKIKLPIDSYNNPDWHYMEKYIKSLPYGAYISKKV